MKINVYTRILLAGVIAALIGASVYFFGIPFCQDRNIRKKIAALAPSFRGARNMYIIRLNRENPGTRFFGLEDYRIKPDRVGAYDYVADLPVYTKDSAGNTKGFMSHWGYSNRHGNWELVRVGRYSEEEMTRQVTGGQ